MLQFRSNKHSQNGEDGILEELLKRLSINQGWFCEFGAWDGKFLSNTFALLEAGWSGVMIEGESLRYKDLEMRAKEFSPRLHPIEAFVEGVEGDELSLDRLLGKTPIPADFDILSIDVDGKDYQIWAALKSYRPKIVVIEINSAIKPGVERVHHLSNSESGSSFTSMIRLGEIKGYKPLCHTGNVIFLRNDLWNEKFSDIPANVEELFYWPILKDRSPVSRLKRFIKKSVGA